MILSGSLSTPFISHETHLGGFVLEGCLPSFISWHVLEISLKDKILGTLLDPQDLFFPLLEENTTQIRMVNGLQKGQKIEALKKKC